MTDRNRLARELVSRLATLAFHKQEHAKRYAEMGIDGAEHLAQYDADIREIETELVRRAMEYDDQAVTLPRCMLEALRTNPGRRGPLQAMTVWELMDIRNEAVRERREPDVRAVDDEIRRRVMEFEAYELTPRSHVWHRLTPD